ncbi:signal peptidase I [Cytobacillus purgationiresistens]|uniref:Signal peptidase I n=1 Tax=Cytobacillus purgationiresistens TaxID=863449 RepID=A0ABU0AEH8_9BACI|nr:signal peptidase I [Cytobacillus purgationiresistens]MDQ0269151.1 signal peptidase I [Cytobacillus purgationiresistens]
MSAIFNQAEESQPEISKATSWKSWFGFILSMIVLFLFFRFAISVTIVSGNSMNPTIENNDILISNQLYFNLNNGDIIVFHDPHGYDVIKRIIASPNDTVEIKDGNVLVNDTPLEENYITGTANDMEKITVLENSYFVIGDNRTPGESLDSRSQEVGLITKEAIKGEIMFSLYPMNVKIGHE